MSASSLCQVYHHFLFLYILLSKPFGSQFDRANGKQNSGLINFVLESHLPFVQISSTCQKWPQRPETGIRDGFEEMELIIVRKSTTTFSDALLL